MRICKAGNALATDDVGAVIATFKRRSSGEVDAAVKLAVAKQWLRFDGSVYTLTQAGTALGRRSRAGRRTARVSPF